MRAIRVVLGFGVDEREGLGKGLEVVLGGDYWGRRRGCLGKVFFWIMGL